MNSNKKKYKAFVVPFCSKGYLKPNSNEHKILGRAYYLYDDNYMIYKQFVQIDSATFRPTDKEMIKTTGHYLNESKKEIIKLRKDYLEPYQIQQGFEINEISKKQNIRLKIPKSLLNKINKELLKLNRVKASIELFKGSNSTGSETRKKASEIITYYKNDFSKSGCNFSNPFIHNSVYKKKTTSINSISEIELISLYDFLDKSPKAYKIYWKYNFKKYYVFEETKEPTISEIYKGIKSEAKVKRMSLKDSYEESVTNTKEFIDDFIKTKSIDNKNDKKFLVAKLRRIQIMLVTHEIEELYKDKNPEEFGDAYNSIMDYPSPNSEFAHIVPTYESLKCPNRYFEVADNNNCLLLSPDLHTSYDKLQIYFDENTGNCIFLSSNKVVPNIVIKKEWLSVGRQKYLSMYKKYLDNSRNL